MISGDPIPNQVPLVVGDGLVKKRTTIMTNSKIVGEYLARKCCGDHSHAQLKGGNRCTLAATYTPEFAQALVEGYKLHMRAKGAESANSKTVSPSCKEGSLRFRDTIDSPLNALEINAEDEEDLLPIDVLTDMFSALLPESKIDENSEKPYHFIDAI